MSSVSRATKMSMAEPAAVTSVGSDRYNAVTPVLATTTRLRRCSKNFIHTTRRRYPCRCLITFYIHELFEDVFHLHQILRVLHHLIDVLVGPGDFVQQNRRMTVLDALHRTAKVVHVEQRACFRPRVPTAGAMWR